MIEILSWLGTLAFLITIVSAFLIVKLPHKFIVKFLLIPMILCAGLMFADNINQVLGFPFSNYPTGKFGVKDYRVTFVSEGVMNIEVWVLQKGKSRLYVIPYNKDVEKELQQAVAERRKGDGTRELQFGKKEGGQDGPEGDKQGKGKKGGSGMQLSLSSTHINFDYQKSNK